MESREKKVEHENERGIMGEGKRWGGGIRNDNRGSGEMTRWLRAPCCFGEGQKFSPQNTSQVAHNHLELELQGINTHF